MVGLDNAEVLKQNPGMEFSVIPDLSDSRTNLHLGAGADESTHAELSVIDNILYLAQPNPTNPDLTSNSELSGLYLDRESNEWYLMPIEGVDLPIESGGILKVSVGDLINPKNEASTLSPIGIVSFNETDASFRFFPRIIQSSVWNGAKFEPQVVDLYVETEDKIYDFTSKVSERDWGNILTREKPMAESRRPIIADIRDKANRLTQILRGLNEDSGTELPKNMQAKVEFNQITRQYLLTVHMHKNGVEEFIGLGKDEIREVGNEYGFGNRIIFLISNTIPTPEDDTKLIRGAFYIQQYDQQADSYTQTEILSGVDIIGEPAKRGKHWKMSVNTSDPEKLLSSLNGLTRSLRARRKK